MLQGRLQIYPSSLAMYLSLKGRVRWKGSVCAAVPAVECCEVVCVVSVLSSAEAQDGQRGCARSLRAVCEQGGAQGHLASSIAKGSLAAEQGGRTRLWMCSRAS